MRTREVESSELLSTVEKDCLVDVYQKEFEIATATWFTIEILGDVKESFHAVYLCPKRTSLIHTLQLRATVHTSYQ